MIAHLPSREFVDLTLDDGRLRHVAALDGLRGLAVAAVVVFHLDLPVGTGGFLGVSTFFTLSGFLIASLLLVELDRTGRVDLRRFWSRRARRLLAASLVTVAATVVVLGHLVGTPDQRAGLRGDAVASVLQVANWRFLASGAGYANLFEAPSPLLHFWSLAVEEQLYLLLPVLVVGLWRAGGGRRTVLVGGLAVAAAASAALPALAAMSPDRVYLGTDTRAAEVLVGAVLAAVLSDRTVRRRTALRRTYRVPVVAAGAAALVVQLWWWWGLGRGTPWLSRGGFALHALLTAAVVAAAVVPFGPVRKVLGATWLRWLGLRSFGLYLVHWPVLLVVRRSWPDLWTPARVALSVGASLVLAEASFRWVERPVRAGLRPRVGHGGRAAAVAVGATLVVAVLPVAGGPRLPPIDFEAGAERFAEVAARPTAPAAVAPVGPPPTVLGVPPAALPAALPAVLPAVPAGPTVSVFGDSTALLLGLGLDEWARRNPGGLSVVGGDAEIGCGVSRWSRIRAVADAPPMPQCAAWPTRWSAEVARRPPDVAVLLSAAWEVPDVQLPGSDRWTSLLEPGTAAHVRRELTAAVDLLASRGSLVVLVAWPRYASWAAAGQGRAVERQHEPARMDRLHEVLREVSASRPRTVRVLDLAEWLGARAEDGDLRPDGIHIPGPVVTELAPQFVVPELTATWSRWRSGE